MNQPKKYSGRFTRFRIGQIRDMSDMATTYTGSKDFFYLRAIMAKNNKSRYLDLQQLNLQFLSHKNFLKQFIYIINGFVVYGKVYVYFLLVLAFFPFH